MGYPLPDGDAFEDDVECLMVFIPARDEYRRAFRSALDYFSNWVAWQRDTEKRGRDAAHSWELANYQTWECYDMNVCTTMLSLLTEIRDNTGIYCCDPVDISEGDQYTDEVTDGVGDVPQNIIDAGYATGVSDWTGFDDYKCIISHLMISNMKAQTEKILSYTDTAGAIAGGVAALAAIAAVILTGGGAVLVFGIILGIVGAAGLYTAFAELGEAGLSDLVDDLETNHDEMACAVYNADGSAGAVVDLKAKIDELFSVPEAAFLKNLNLPAQLKALYAGRYDQQDIAQTMADEGYDPLDYTCSCEEVPPLVEGANLEMLEITGVNAYGGSGAEYWTIHGIDEGYGNGVEVDVEHLSASGHHFYIELTLAPSAYHEEPDATFRGITYLIISTATGTEYDHRADVGTHVQVGYPAGNGRRTSWFGLHSEPYGGFKEECEAILENTYYAYETTTGLSQLPDQPRTLLLRFTVNGAQRYFLRVHTMYWAIDYHP